MQNIAFSVALIDLTLTLCLRRLAFQL